MPPTPIVFIVDDDAHVRESIAALVASHGLSTRGYRSAEDFLDSGDHQLPGCIVTDVRMSGMDGYRLHSRLRAEGSRNPVIIITGYADAGLARQQPEGLTVMEKSCGGQTLLREIQRALDELS